MDKLLLKELFPERIFSNTSKSEPCVGENAGSLRLTNYILEAVSPILAILTIPGLYSPSLSMAPAALGCRYAFFIHHTYISQTLSPSRTLWNYFHIYINSNISSRQWGFVGCVGKGFFLGFPNMEMHRFRECPAQWQRLLVFCKIGKELGKYPCQFALAFCLY